MKRGAEVVNLEVLRIKQADPHVRIIIEAWHVKGTRWYVEPCTTSRMGEPTKGGWGLLADACESYAHDLRRHAGINAARKHGRRHRVRPRHG